MIKFPCHCSYLFKLEDDMAGSLIQCPKCGRLNDIPLLSDLEHIAEDGTFKLDDSSLPVKEEPGQRLEELDLTFSRLRAKEEDIDLRPTLEDVARAGEVSDEEARARTPKYDPITGELIRPMELQKERPAEHPVPYAKAAIGYASDRATQGLVSGMILIELLTPVNLLVQGIIAALLLGAQLIVLGLACVLSILSVSAGLAYLPFLPLVLAHYGNVIDETGREARDELPRPFRDLSWADDLWGPFYRMALGLMICYWPAILLASWGLDLGWNAVGPALILAAAGTFFLPAVWLTSVSSGTIMNLRPDRVLKMVGACLPAYLLTVVALGLSIVFHAIYLVRMLGVSLVPATALTAHPRLKYLNHYGLAFMALFIGVYLMHFVCWHLGSLYNRHNDRFPWVLQRHIPLANRQRPPSALPAPAPRRRRQVVNPRPPAVNPGP